MIVPFVDPKTKGKILMAYKKKDLEKHFEEKNLPGSIGGTGSRTCSCEFRICRVRTSTGIRFSFLTEVCQALHCLLRGKNLYSLGFVSNIMNSQELVFAGAS